MGEFEQRAEQFFQRAAQQYQSPFEIAYQVECCGKVFPMVAQYKQQETRYMWGIKSAIARDGLCGELCFFDRCEKLEDASLAQYVDVFRRIQDERVPCDNPGHDYTLISLVLCVDHVDRHMQRKIKKIRDDRQYKNGKYGWSVLRVCVVDLSEDQYYCNAMGKGIVECLTRESMPQNGKKRFHLF